MIISSQGWSNVSLFKLEKLFGLVLALGKPVSAERMKWTNFTEVEFWRRHYRLGFKGIRFKDNNHIVPSFMIDCPIDIQTAADIRYERVGHYRSLFIANWITWILVKDILLLQRYEIVLMYFYEPSDQNKLTIPSS